MTAPSRLDTFVHHCRSGSEKECAAEITAVAERAGAAGHVRAKPDSAVITFEAHGAAAAAELAGALTARRLVFARQVFRSPGLLGGLPVDDRVTPLVQAAKALAPRFSTLFVERPDTDEGKRLARFCRALTPPLRRALAEAGLLAESGAQVDCPRLHLLFLSATVCYPGLAAAAESSPWPMGIPRLKLPRGAPSRAALKLEEAFQVLVPSRVRERALGEGRTAVDLGAAPGGWTYVLARRGLHVTAVDNAALGGDLARCPLVEHRREDGLRYRPPMPVDWLVCDMAERPSRVAALVADWLASGACKYCIFNLKLPMRRRFEAVCEARSVIERSLRASVPSWELRIKQLYHDRQEVTGFARR